MTKKVNDTGIADPAKGWFNIHNIMILTLGIYLNKLSQLNHHKHTYHIMMESSNILNKMCIHCSNPRNDRTCFTKCSLDLF